jgi:hypothetical protein
LILAEKEYGVIFQNKDVGSRGDIEFEEVRELVEE